MAQGAFPDRPVATGLPAALCAQCQSFSERATRHWVPEPGWRARLKRISGRCALAEARSWSSNSCPLCGEALQKACPACRAPIADAEDRHCRACGEAYPWSAARSTASSEQAEGESAEDSDGGQ